MFGLTTLGVFHTVISLIALLSGVVVLVRHKEISLKSRSGQIYLAATLVSALTSLGIFRHGGFGAPHALALLTLVALAVGVGMEKYMLLGRWSRYLQALSYSVTILFHCIPGVTESLTRLPFGAPIAASPEDPFLKPIFLGLLIAFLIGMTLQLRWLRNAPPP